MIPHVKPLLGKEEEAGVLEVLRSGMLAAGSRVEEFERQFCAYNNSRHAIAASSGTTALHAMMEAVGIGPGDKVFVTAYSFIASANAILYTGATPVFVDIDPVTGNLSPGELEKSIKKHPGAKAVLVVHIFGLPADMDKIVELAQRHKIMLLEDCAQAVGAAYRGVKVGNFGRAAAFSYYPTKNMTSGEGGMVVTGEPGVAEKVRIIINQGQRRRYFHELVGYNYRMSDVHAAIGLAQLAKLEGFNRKRIENAGFYEKRITNPAVEKPAIPTDRVHVFNQYTIRVPDREKFTLYLTEKGIGHGVYYPLIIPEQIPYRNAPSGGGHWPGARKLAGRCVSIPVHPSLTPEELRYVAEVINSYG
ncbi:UDP-4-amino-4-deoxy-L-arabinose--oxoglutarateam inotransferase [Desulfocucumis palustris]|uniref:UDP-4-amino-4-deoxy-L-arabinose--oxoglutarateam inotransferase n=1 Tax=Desulfocucumis palustris TaxID=1898651 RepID=A0A2L2XB70_9FIRM|nr:DegT/DnrJ/EryC1/StrS family aminotransferase [Desulfocucumis palustris]GBF33455.1 UDP-4-amino-4-deoxy-L-arabinose--oxoglutarateam inotransferase [Desulfocucumis palustris]